MRSNWTTQEIDAFLRIQFQGLIGRGLKTVPYHYPLTFTGLDGGTIQTQTLQINANADFILFEVAYAAVGLGNFIDWPINAFNLLITDTGSSNQYTQSPVELSTYASGQYYTKNLPYPRKVGGRTALSVQVENYSGDDFDYLQLNFAGVLVYSNMQY